MAFYDENDEENQQGGGGVAPQPEPAAGGVATGAQGSSTLSGGGAPGSAGGGGAPMPGTGAPAPAAASSGSGGASSSKSGAGNNFVGISQYLNANKPQSAKLAKQVGSFVGQAGQDARHTLSKQQGQFNQAVDQNTVKLNQGLVDEAMADPAKVAADQAKLNEFHKQRDANYQGPQAFEGSSFYQPAKQAVDKGIQTVNNTGSATGQRQILGDIQTNTAGKKNEGALTFDSALLGADPAARARMQNARQVNADLGQKLEGAKVAGNERATQAAAQTKATQEAIKAAFGGQQGEMETALQGKAQEQLAKARAQAADLNAKANTNDYNFNEEELKTLGVTPEQWGQFLSERQRLQNTGETTAYRSFAPFLKNTGTPEAQINAQNVASAEDYAKYVALNQLMGTQGEFLKDPSLAGTANTDTMDLDFDRLLSQTTSDANSREGMMAETNRLRSIGPNSSQAAQILKMFGSNNLGDHADRFFGGDVRAAAQQLGLG